MSINITEKANEDNMSSVLPCLLFGFETWIHTVQLGRKAMMSKLQSKEIQDKLSRGA